MIYKDHKNRKSIRTTLEYMFRESPQHGHKMNKVIFLSGSSTSRSPLIADNNGKITDVDVSEIVDEFEFQTSLYKGSSRESKFYNHASLSLQANEHLTPEQWEEAAQILQDELGFEYDNSLYCGAIHLDKQDQLHIHIASNRVDINGELISQHNNWEKAQRATKKICQKFGLEVIPSSFDELGNQNNDRTDRMTNRIEREGDKTKLDEIKDVDVRAKIRRTIASVFKQDKPKTISDYASSLEKRGVILKGVEGQVGECIGVKYNMPAIKDKYYSGSKISSSHASWGSLLNEKRKGLTYEPFRDNSALCLVPVMRAKVIVNKAQVVAIKRLKLNVSIRRVGRATCIDLSFCLTKQARDTAKWIDAMINILKMLFSGSKVRFYTPLELSKSSMINKNNVECIYNADDQQACFKGLTQDTELWRNIEEETQGMDQPYHRNYHYEEELFLSI